VCQLLLEWYGLPPFLCGPAYLTANFIRGCRAGSVHFVKCFGQLFRIGRPTLPVCFGYLEPWTFGPWFAFWPTSFFHCFLLGLRFILGLFLIELGDLATPIIIPRVKFPELIQDFPDFSNDNGFDLVRIGFAGYLQESWLPNAKSLERTSELLSA
jgi:hypothetical protein